MQATECQVKEICTRTIKRMAWRLQYRVRRQREKEQLFPHNLHETAYDFSTTLVSDLYVRELLDQIPSPKCQYIIRRILIDGLTEREVSIEVNLSQQAVSKWKRKGLETLRSHILRY